MSEKNGMLIHVDLDCFSGVIPAPRSYLKDFHNVFVMACGTNFYQQCVPGNTVHLGLAATCAHWLRQKPCDIKNHLINAEINDKEEKEMFSKQAEKDWELFLLNRAEELAPGKLLLLIDIEFAGRTLF